MEYIYKKFLRLLGPFRGLAPLLVSVVIYGIILNLIKNTNIDTAFLAGGLSVLFVDYVLEYLKKLGE